MRLNEGAILEVSAPEGATEKQVRRRGRYGLILGALVTAALFAAVAYADNTDADGDGTTQIGNNDLDFGTVCVGQESTATVLLGARRTGNYPGPQVWANSATVTFSVFHSAGTGLSASMDVGATAVNLPSDWSTKTNNTVQGTARSTVSITPASTGSYVGSVDYRGSGAGSQGGTVNRDDFMAVTANVIDCAPANAAPTTPGKPAPTPASPNQGGFTLDWTASTDDGNPNPPAAVTYELEGKDADDAAFAGVASAVATNSYGFAAGSPAEGTWTYRVRASDSALTSDWSSSSDPVVVDRTAPSFGACPAGGPFLLNSGSQSVGPIGASDGSLPDGSAGSGVDALASTLSGTVDTSTVGSKSVTFTAVDNAENSNEKACSYSVIYDFHGFFRPIDNQPAINVAKAGSAIPVKFDLSGDQGLGIFAAASPSSVRVACDAGADQDVVEETVTAGGSSLSYDPSVNVPYGQYIYVWKTDKTWAGTCRRLDVKLNDGTTHSANFKFTK
jgi:hypothetical protein